MYVNSGYLNNSRIDFKDTSRPLTVASCGTYRLDHHQVLPTHRPRGRLDFQLLYVATGQARFFFNKREEAVKAGSFVLYCPKEEQKYVYYAEERPEVYWVHFTGYDARNILNYYRLTSDRHVYRTGTRPEFKWIFQRMILELQLKKPLFEELLTNLLSDLLLMIRRQMELDEGYAVETEVEEAVSYFNEHYNQKLSILEYARAHHISANQFIRNFNQVVNMTPKQYLVSLRITNAQMLLESGDYSVQEVASIVGYSDPLYFSQVFRKEVGIPPSHYRREHSAQEK